MNTPFNNRYEILERTKSDNRLLYDKIDNIYVIQCYDNFTRFDCSNGLEKAKEMFEKLV